MRRRHTTITSLPPGTSARRTFLRAATGLAKNIVPNRENATSKSSSPEQGLLHVGHEKARVDDTRLAGLADGILDEARRSIDADGLAVWADESRDPLGGIAKTTAYVQNPLPGRERVQAQRLLAVGAQPGGDCLAEPNEAVVERSVPRTDRLIIGCRRELGLGCAH